MPQVSGSNFKTVGSQPQTFGFSHLPVVCEGTKLKYLENVNVFTQQQQQHNNNNNLPRPLQKFFLSQIGSQARSDGAALKFIS
jgi:hypothetical protein